MTDTGPRYTGTGAALLEGGGTFPLLPGPLGFIGVECGGGLGLDEGLGLKEGGPPPPPDNISGFSGGSTA